MRQYARLLASDNTRQMDQLKKRLALALRQDVTPRQRECLTLYYVQGMSIPDISRLLGVNRSSVSRTLRRGREKLYRCLRYGAPDFLPEGEPEEESETPAP